MKTLKTLTAVGLMLPFLAAPIAGWAQDTGKTATPYPLATCVVSGEKLGEMGKAYVFTYEGQEVKLCCKDCKKKFDKDPAKYMAKIKEAEAKK